MVSSGSGLEREALRENVHKGVLAVRRTLHGVIFLMDFESSPPTSTCLWVHQRVDGGNSGIKLERELYR